MCAACIARPTFKLLNKNMTSGSINVDGDGNMHMHKQITLGLTQGLDFANHHPNR